MPQNYALPSPPKTLPLIAAHGLMRVFADGRRFLEVLTDVNLELVPGEFAALVGRSGSGKSTLLHLLGLLDKPDGGELLWEGRSLNRLGERGRAALRNRQIGFVFQHYHLLPEFSVFDNVLLPGRVGLSPFGWMRRKKDLKIRAEELLAAVDLTDRAQAKPDVLSGGERQRAALARALLLKPRLLLCDEPTGNLDPETGARIMNLLSDLSRKEGAAVLTVTHEAVLCRRADRVLRLENGRLRLEKI
jgi:lipoprotein-releasing system ATP-binding protein